MAKLTPDLTIQAAQATLAKAVAKLKAVPALVGQADNSTLFQGKTVAQVKTLADAVSAAHRADKNDPHHLKPGDVGIYTTPQVEALFTGRLPEGKLPLDSVGTQSYLPLGVGGTFEGATSRTAPINVTPLWLEGDGSIVYLRDGTSGSTTGVYYAFLDKFLTAAGGTQPTSTNRRYRPSYFPAGTEAAFMLGFCDNVLIGRLQDANGTLGDIFVSWTNGTFDDARHTGIIIPIANWPAGNGEFRISPQVSGASVYLFHVEYIYTPSSPFDITVYTLPVANLKAGSTTNPAQVTGITTNGFAGALSGLPVIRLANVVVSSVASEKPIILKTSAGVAWGVINLSHYDKSSVVCATNASGVIRVKLAARAYGENVTVGSASYYNISFTFDPATKVATLDPGLTASQSVFASDAQGAITIAGPIFNSLDGRNDLAWPVMGNGYVSQLVSQGWVVSYYVDQVVDNMYIARGKIPNYTNAYDALQYGRAAMGQVGVWQVTPKFGSAIGGSIGGVYQLSGNAGAGNLRNVVFSVGRYANGNQAPGLAYTDVEGTANYTYRSLYAGTLQGYRPSAGRQMLSDLGLNPADFVLALSEVSGNNVVTSGARFMEDFKVSGKARLNNDLTVTGSVQIAPAVLASLKASMVARLQSLNGMGPLRDASIEVAVPQAFTSIGLIAFGVVNDTNNNTWYYVGRASITSGNAQNVAGATLTGDYYAQQVLTGNGVGVARNNHDRVGAAAIYDAGDCYLIGLCMVSCFWVTGGAPNISVALAINKASGQIDTRKVFYTAQHLTIGIVGWIAHPAHGLCFVYNTVGTGGTGDEMTKALINSAGKNSWAEFSAWTPPGTASGYLVLVSQDMAQGWVVYFTEATPATVGGRSITLPVGSVDLRSLVADPSNKTFYVYVETVAGVTNWRISLSILATDHTRFYVGTVVTGAAVISSINLNKALRFGGYTLSDTAKGGSIPISLGQPYETPKTHW